MHMGANAIHAHQFARHKKTRYLITPILAGNGGFKKACAYGIKRRKGFAWTKQKLAFFQTATLFNHRI